MSSIGIDIGKKRWVVYAVRWDGSVREETRCHNTRQAAMSFVEYAAKKHGPCQTVCESTDNLRHKTFESFEEYSMPIILTNLFRTQMMVETTIKTDALDARPLADLLRDSLVAGCHADNLTVSGQRYLLRRKVTLVQEKTGFVTRLRNPLDLHDANQTGAGSHMEDAGHVGADHPALGRPQ